MATAPPTVANLGVGFDLLGTALPIPGDTVQATLSATPGVRLLEVTGDSAGLPSDPSRNVATVAARAVLDAAAPNAGLELKLHKAVPPASGLGSSGSSAAAGAVAAAMALGLDPLPRSLLLDAACAGEAAATGSPHADNAAPALFGGLVLVRRGAELEVLPLPLPPGLHIAVVLPEMSLDTASARAALPATVPMSAAVAQAGDLAATVLALHSGDLELLGRCLQDRLAEPYRADLLPALAPARARALAEGALGMGISGAGPSLFALARAGSAERIGAALVAAHRDVGLGARVVHAGPLGGPGAMRLDAALQPG